MGQGFPVPARMAGTELLDQSCNNRDKYEKQCRVLRQQLAMQTKRVMMPVKAMKYKKTMKNNTSVRRNRAKCKAMKTMKAMKA